MQPILDHLDNIVRPTLRNYVTADQLFMEAQKSGVGVDEARHAAMLAARHAAIDLHHLSDFVVNNSAPGAIFADLRAARAAVQSHLIFLREPKAPCADDVVLLGDVADAFKHFKLDRPNRTVDGANVIIMTGTGWGKLRWG
jgi:Holliday junction resolvasome RuvABC endonuclease subunit